MGNKNGIPEEDKRKIEELYNKNPGLSQRKFCKLVEEQYKKIARSTIAKVLREKG
jgi:hypothetical protein